MPRINVLDKELSNMIAAGEVVERPASVVKELVENSIDAGANSITVEIRNGGKTYIRVTDNGCGMNLPNARKAFLCHATSKIKDKDDLHNISTMGFRGEAIPAIASVSMVELFTKTEDDDFGHRILYSDGEEQYIEEMGMPKGCTFIVRDLFYNIPARQKFLKKDSTETANIVSLMNKFTIGYPLISFQLIVDGRTTLSTPKDSNLLDAIYTVYGREITDNLLRVSSGDFDISVEGYVSKPRLFRSNRNFQLFFVNGRIIKNKTIIAAIDRAYHNRMMTGKYPVVILKISVSPRRVDVNVHPTKTEVRFTDEQKIFDSVYYAITTALDSENSFSAYSQPSPENSPQEHFSGITAEEYPDYIEKNRVPAMEVSDIAIPPLNPPSSANSEKNSSYFTPPNGYAQMPVFSNAVIDVEQNPEYHSRFSQVPSAMLSDEYYTDVKANEMEMFHNELLFNYIGELFKTYIIIECGMEFYLIDKHAAHERILFDKIEKSYRTGERYSQTLLMPISVTLTPEEYDTLFENADKVNAIGFEFEEFGNNKVILRKTPYVMDVGDIVPTFVEVITLLSENKNIEMTKFENDALKMIACKAAIKAGFETSEKELRLFAENLIKTGTVNYCPHGRPIICRFSKKSIEKAFKRIV